MLKNGSICKKGLFKATTFSHIDGFNSIRQMNLIPTLNARKNK